jgi:hypothetical protein
MKIQDCHLHEFTLPTFLCQGKRRQERQGVLPPPQPSEQKNK